VDEPRVGAVPAVLREGEEGLDRQPVRGGDFADEQATDTVGIRVILASARSNPVRGFPLPETEGVDGNT
jgi:hypothetical protein